MAWRLSPSDLTFLWDECPRCFYLKVIRGFGRPWSGLPSVFSQIDRLTKGFFRGKAAQEICPGLGAGVVHVDERWVISQPLTLGSQMTECTIVGKLDAFVALDDGTFGIVDFKTTEPKPGHVRFYSRQLHAYAYAVEHPAPGKLALSPVARLGLLCLSPDGMERRPDGRLATLGSATWLEIPKDESGFLMFLEGVARVLEMPDPPDPSPRCGWCEYRESARRSGW